MRKLLLASSAAICVSALVVACASGDTRWVEPEAPPLPAPEERDGDEICVAGQLFKTGTRVVLWDEEGGYDAYSTSVAFPDELRGAKAPVGARHGMRRGLGDEEKAEIQARGWQLEELRDKVDQFVIHYDVCGTSRQCFKILHDRRKLSVHFMLDVDGTIYQTLDLKERAWHGSKANDRSIGVEIAHIGAYPRKEHRVLIEWYRRDESGPFVRFPKWMKKTGVRTEGFVARPARAEPVEGVVQGTRLYQYDFTAEQYEALAKLTAALSRALPKIRLDVPRDANGAIVDRVLAPADFAAHSGLLGHFHVQKNKTDPGPAFDWERVLRAARAHAEAGTR